MSVFLSVTRVYCIEMAERHQVINTEFAAQN